MADVVLTLPNSPTLRGVLADTAGWLRSLATSFDATGLIVSTIESGRTEDRADSYREQAAQCRELASLFEAAVVQAIETREVGS